MWYKTDWDENVAALLLVTDHYISPYIVYYRQLSKGSQSQLDKDQSLQSNLVFSTREQQKKIIQPQTGPYLNSGILYEFINLPRSFVTPTRTENHPIKIPLISGHIHRIYCNGSVLVRKLLTEHEMNQNKCGLLLFLSLKKKFPKEKICSLPLYNHWNQAEFCLNTTCFPFPFSTPQSFSTVKDDFTKFSWSFEICKSN